MQTWEWTVKAEKRGRSGLHGHSAAGSGQWGLQMLREEFLRSGLNLETFLKRKTKESTAMQETWV